MPVATTDFSDGTSDLYDRVFSEVNLADDPPKGLIFHWTWEVVCRPFG